MIKINLLATDLIKKEERYELVVLAYALLFIGIVTAGLNIWSKYNANNKLEYRVSQSERELIKYESILKQVETLQSTTNILETKKSIIGALMKSRLTYVYFMEDMLALLPNNLWFKSLTTRLGVDGTISANLDADALDNYAIADVVSALSSDVNFSGTELGAITTTSNAKNQISSFKLKFSYKKKNI